MVTTQPDPARSTRRQRGRAAAIEEIKAAALDELRQHGARGVTMRGVARAVDMTPSGLYRYFDDHGALLAALCVDAHDSLSAVLDSEQGLAPDVDCRSRWFRGSLALRTWALTHVDEYALVVGPPLPGVDVAHRDLVRAAGRLRSHATRTVAEAIVSGELLPAPVSRAVSRMASEAPNAGTAVPGEVRAVTTGAVAALLGAVSFEAFGHLPGVAADREEHFRAYSLAVMRGMGFADVPDDHRALLPDR
ncbi:MAG TPA: TetR/AcrR family transcriptional regulator [Ornithinibacter sp.]|nr:TetR/AcrR family transcriptional regulator [Ornithinibacter sp.]